ncbi:hypothetical protein OIU85_000253 [Salix viminalis]|uniref:Alpha/beta hydrolase fold-3 domain-containing protein n=1 Tax=Salix viminalis TaxID=40686 RepID=A0A9Q0VJ64_SALVM|nr:hypothetical protein OIU85_000253 [Salix viminalis]
MVTGKKIVDEVSGYLRVFEDGTVDRTWTGPPEFGFLMEPVSPHEEFIDGVAVRDQTIEPKSGLAVRIYIPGNDHHDVHSTGQLPVILHFHGGGCCISQPDMYMRVYLVGDSTGGNLVHQVAARAGADDIEPLRIGGGVAIHPGFLRAEPTLKTILSRAQWVHKHLH